MSFRHSPEGKIDKRILHACAKAIKALEEPQGFITPYNIGREDDEDYCRAKRLLWGIIETHGYTIDVDSNRLCKVKEG